MLGFVVTQTAAACGVVVLERNGLGLATVLVRKGQFAALNQRVHDLFGFELPSGPQRVMLGEVAFTGIGPAAWLATHEQAGNAFAECLTMRIGTWAAVSDQTDGYAVLRLSGLKVRDALSKLVPIDLHSRAFCEGDVVSTATNHIPVILWRRNDSAVATPVFEAAVPRSIAHSFRQALTDSAAEYGLEVAHSID